jgi:autotransporter-associated beta strand protein
MMGHSTLTTRGRTGQGGGTILVGDHIALLDNTSVNAQGATGGGHVLVGGDWQGGANAQRRVLADPNALHQATTVTMAQGARIDASATDNGKGGTVVLWSDITNANSVTTASGSIAANGGLNGGDGGLVETSGYQLDTLGAVVRASSTHGVGGLWLLDPTDSTVTQAIADGYVSTLNSGTSVENMVTGNMTVSNGVQIQKTAGGDATLTLKAAGNITIGSGVTIESAVGANKLNVILWSDSDVSGGGAISFGGNASINTRGGHLTLAGGAGSVTPSGYASQITTVVAGNLSFTTAGGDVLLKASVASVPLNNPAFAVQFLGGLSIDAGAGSITMEGLSSTTSALVGISFEGVTTLASSKASGTAISITGDNTSGSAAVRFFTDGTGVPNLMIVKATGGGNITINSTGSGTTGTRLFLENVRVLASTGDITINSSQNITIENQLNATTIFGKMAGQVDNSSSNITLNTNFINGVTSNDTNANLTFDTTGQVTIQPFSTTTATQRNGRITFAPSISGLTLGKSGHGGSYQIESPISISGPISIEGRNITANAALTTSSGSSGAVLLKATAGILSTASITTNGADITLWSNSGTNTTTASSVGGIQVNDNVVLDSRTAADRTASTHTTGGGAITLGGGSATGSTANGTTVPTGYAMNYSTTESGLILGSDTATSHVSGIRLLSGGGHISVSGRSNQAVGGNTLGIKTYEGLTVNAGTTGNITLNGLANSTGGSAGIDMQAFRITSTNTNAALASSFTTANGAIVFTGSNTSTNGNGLQFAASSLTTGITLQATGTGSITLNGSIQMSTSGDMFINNTNLLAANGNITLNANGLGTVSFNTVNIGRLSGSSVSASSSNITVNANRPAFNASTTNFTTSGTVTIQPVGTSFSDPLSPPSSNLTFSSDISALTLGKSGNTADITIGSATSIAGPINVFAGILNVTAGLTTTNTTTGNVTFNAATITGSGNIALANGRALSVTQTGNSTYSGIVSGTDSSLTKLGAGTLTLTGANSYTGTSTITAGTLQVGDGGTTGTLGSGAVTNNAALTFNRSNDLTAANVISGTGTLTKLGAGTLTLTGLSSYTGITTISAGVLRLGAAGDGNNSPLGINASGTVVANGGTLDLNGISLSTSEPLSITGSGAGTTGALGALVNFSTTSVTYGGLLSLGGNATIHPYTGSINLSNTGIISGSGHTLTLTGQSTNNQLAGILALGSGGLTLPFNGSTYAWSLSGANTYTGPTNIVGGTLRSTHSSALGNGSAVTITLNNSSTLLDISGGDLTIGSLTSTASSSSTRVSLGSRTLTIGTNNTNTDFRGVITGSGGLTKVGTGSLTLLGANTHTGATTVSAGTLVVANATALGTTDAGTNVASGATLSIQAVTVGAEEVTLNGGTLAARSGNTLSSLSGSVVLGADSTVDVTGNDTTELSLSGVISGGFGFTKTGTGRLVLSGNNTYTGTTTISGGTLRLGAAGDATNTPLGTAAAGTVVASGAGLDLNGFTLGTAEALTINGTGQFSFGALTNRSTNAATYSGLLTLGSDSTIGGSTSGGPLVLSNPGTITGSGFRLTLNGTSTASSLASTVGTDTGGLTKSGAGTWTLTGDNTYTGTTTVSAGTLQVGSGGTSGRLGSGAVSGTGSLVFNRSDNVALSALAPNAGTIAASNITITGTAGITIDRNISATGILTLVSSGSITSITHSVAAQNLLLQLQGGDVTITPPSHLSNNVGTLAATGVGALTYTDSNALTIGTVSGTAGLSASGPISVATLTGDLTVSANVSTTNSTADAILLNAGRSTAAGTSMGGNLIVSGSPTPTLTAGTGGFIRLMTGSVSGSTGLTDLVGSGTGRFRYNSDESVDGYTTALSPNVIHAIYRESPTTVTLTGLGSTITYGDTFTPSSVSATTNGDTFSLVVANPLYSTSGFLRYQATPYTLSNNLTGLGYTVTGVPSNLTVNRKTLTASLPSATKVYDGSDNLQTTSLTLAGKATTDVVNVSGTGAFASRNVGTGLNYTVSNLALSVGGDSDNYQLASTSLTGTGEITRLSSVTWVGGTTGNWFDPANWAGGAVPDLSNVANVVIPSGVTVSFGSSVVAPAQSGAVSIDGLTGAGGNLSQSAGTLSVGAGGITLGSLTQSAGTMANSGSTTLDTFTQSGGSFTGTGNMTTASFAQTGGSTTLLANLSVTQDFNQASLGNVSVGGNATITDTVGGLQMGNFSSVGALAVNSTDGAITQATGTALTAQSTSSFTATQGGQPAAIDLSNAGNDFVGAVGLSGSNVIIVDANALTLGNVTATGNLNATAATDLAVNGVVSANTLTLTATTGNITQSAGSTITVATGPSNFVAGGSVTLGRTNSFTGSVNGWDGNSNPSPVPPVQPETPKVDAGNTVGVILSGNAHNIASPATTLTSSSAPPELVLSASAGSSSAKASQQSNVSNANSEGVTIDVRNAAVQDEPIMAAVSLPKGSATSGTGFSFELPSNIRELVQTPDNVQATLPNGGSLPAWLKFDAQAMRFEASAVPDGAFPMQVAIQLGKQRVLVVISERTE